MGTTAVFFNRQIQAFYRVFLSHCIGRYKRLLSVVSLSVLLSFVISAVPAWAQIAVQVNIEGVNAALEANIRLHLSVEQQKDHPLMSEARLRILQRKAAKEIAAALEPYGYYRPRIASNIEALNTESWKVTYTVDAGDAIRISLFDVRLSEAIAGDAEFGKLLENLPLAKGQVFNHAEYENIKAGFSRLAVERGYRDAHFAQHKVEIDLAAYEARVSLHFDGGKRYSFGELVLQQDVLSPELLQRYIPFEKGDPYSLLALLDLQQSLNDSDYFSRAEVLPGEPLPEAGEVPINVTLFPRMPHRYSYGLGYGTDTGARASFAWEMPRVNKQGHRISSDIRVSEIGYSLGAHYRIPLKNPRSDQLTYSISEAKESTDDNESTLRMLGLSINTNRGRWRESLFLNYQHEQYEVGTDEGVSTLLIPGVNWTRVWGQGFLSGFEGLRFDVTARGALEGFISDASFFQIQTGLKAINHLAPHTRLISRIRLGSTWTENFHHLPSTLRFFAGGAQSVRGYGYQDLGPVDAGDEVQGGQYLMVGSLEADHYFTEQWGGAVFYDAGNAMDEIGEALSRGVGFGLRWKSPVGPVRLDIANAISEAGRPWRLHFSLGPDL